MSWKRTPVGAYLSAVGIVGLANAIALAAGQDLSGANLVMFLLLAVLVSALGFGLGPALVAAVVTVIAYDFLFLEPRYTFWIGHPADLLTFAVFFAVAIATGGLAGRARDQADQTAKRAAAAGALLEASRALSAAGSRDEAARALFEHAARLTGGTAVVLVPDETGLRLAAAPEGVTSLGADTLAAAEAAWRGEPSPPRQGGWAFIPLKGLGGQVGVVGLRAPGRVAGEDETLLDALLHQGGIAMERADLMATAAENQALKRADQLRAALLNSISHDFRTPLASILGSATTLSDFEADLRPAVRRDLLASIAEDTRRIDRYVGDILDMGRLESGGLRPRRVLVDVRVVINNAIGRVNDRLGRRRIRRDFADVLSQAPADATLLEQVVVNLLENALAYAPGDSDIILSAYEDPSHVVISVDDAGPGIAPEELPLVFDRFRRLGRPSDRGAGLGLGLSIAMGFVEAMGGRIAAVSPLADGRGTRFVVSLPKSMPTPGDLL